MLIISVGLLFGCREASVDWLAAEEPFIGPACIEVAGLIEPNYVRLTNGRLIKVARERWVQLTVGQLWCGRQ